MDGRLIHVSIMRSKVKILDFYLHNLYSFFCNLLEFVTAQNNMDQKITLGWMLFWKWKSLNGKALLYIHNFNIHGRIGIYLSIEFLL